jgi:hypothetical protein
VCFCVAPINLFYLLEFTQDLYGGDGVLVKQSSVTAPPIEITCDENGIGVRSQDSYEIYHEQEVAEVIFKRRRVVAQNFFTPPLTLRCIVQTFF